jgi:Zn-dependent membrane protease YugP
MQMLSAQGILMPEELPVARKVLTAAALTYVVGALVAIWQLALLFMQSRR